MSPSADPSSAVGGVTDQSGGHVPFEGVPDDAFAVVAGVYAALLVAPLGTAALNSVVSAAGTLYLALLLGVAGVSTVVALLVRRVPGLDCRLGASRARWGLLLAPTIVGAVVVSPLLTDVHIDLSVLSAGLAAISVMGGLAAGTVLAMMATTRYARALEERASTLAEWRAAWPPERRALPKVVGGVALLAGVGAHLADVVLSVPFTQAAGFLLVPLGIVLFVFGQQPRTYRASSAGLVRQMPATRELYGWDRFDGFAVADDAVVVHFRAPWRFPLVFDRSELEDEDAVIDALRDHLPRLPAR